MTIWTVTGYERTAVMMRVEANSEEEAIEKAKRGDYDDADSEPGPKLMKPAWTADVGWPYGRGNSARRP
jgi:hypothetical protein